MTGTQSHAHPDGRRGLAYWVVVWTLLSAATCRSGEAATATKERTKMNSEPDAGPVQLVHLAVDAEPKYLLGFPVVVAVTFDNSRHTWNHYDALLWRRRHGSG